MRIIYIIGPLRDPNPQKQQANIDYARGAMELLIEAGHAPFCPHTMTEHSHDVVDDAKARAAMLTFIATSDAVLLLPGHEDSEGSKAELIRAREFRLTEYDWANPEDRAKLIGDKR